MILELNLSLIIFPVEERFIIVMGEMGKREQMVDVRSENARRVIERWDEVFRALSAEPRRQLIVSLNDREPDEPAPLPESAINPNLPVESGPLKKELYHSHLPMLSTVGLIEWEDNPLVAYRGPRFEEAAIVFDSLQSSAQEMPDSLVIGCQRLEEERQQQLD
jgi:hypothetical protein